MNGYAIAFVFMVFISSLSQILLKISANEEHTSGITYMINWKVIVSYAVYFGVTLINTLFIYKGLQLSSISMLESFGYIFVPVLSWIFLKEKLQKRQIFGIVLIVAGVVLFSL